MRAREKTGRSRAAMEAGALEGVAMSEPADNAAAVGAFAPPLSLGITGSATSAVRLGGLTTRGSQPGPLLFSEQLFLVHAPIVNKAIKRRRKHS